LYVAYRAEHLVGAFVARGVSYVFAFLYVT
jgi:hypothetical protein